MGTPLTSTIPWSPDGTRIAFASDWDGQWDVWVMGADGTNQMRLTDDPASDDQPSWSPDEKLIVFWHFGGSGGAGLWTVRPDGTEARLLAGGPLHDPAWSPDGRCIAFDGEPHGCRFDVYVMAADGTRTRQLTDNQEGCGGQDKHPSWSPDGKMLVYSSTGYEGMKSKSQLLTVLFAGGEPTLIVPYRVEDLYSGPYHPDWSPVR